MSDIATSNTSGDATSNVSGDAASKSDDVIHQEPKKDTVSYETYARNLSKLKKLEEKLAREEQEKSTAAQKVLEEQGQYKSAFELERKEKLEYKQELDQSKKLISDAIKTRAFLSQIPGTISEDYWEFIKLDEIIIDPDTQKVDAVALEGYAKTWVQKHSRLIDKPTSNVKVPAEAPKLTHLGSVNITIADMAKKLAGLKL